MKLKILYFARIAYHLSRPRASLSTNKIQNGGKQINIYSSRSYLSTLSSARRGRGHNGAEHNKYFEIREVHRLSTYHCRSVAVCVWNYRSSTWLLLDRVWMLWYLVWSLGRLICAFRTLIFFCVNSITQAKVIFPLTTDRKSIHKAVCARYKPTRRRQRTL